LRLQALARGDLAQIAVVDIGGPDQIEICAAPALPIPGRELDLAQILEIELAQDRDALRLDPFLVRGVAADLDLLAFDHGLGRRCARVALGRGAVQADHLVDHVEFDDFVRLPVGRGRDGRGLGLTAASYCSISI
jgi:hypothetical protein